MNIPSRYYNRDCTVFSSSNDDHWLTVAKIVGIKNWRSNIQFKPVMMIAANTANTVNHIGLPKYFESPVINETG